MLYNKEQIKEIIPHRDPFLLVDQINYISEDGRTIEGELQLTGEEAFFKGHFPGFPVMPGVLIVEALAQVGSVLLLSIPENKGKVGMFGGINKIRFKRQVRPGDRLILKATFTKNKLNVYFADVEATVEGEIACTGEIMSAVSR